VTDASAAITLDHVSIEYRRAVDAPSSIKELVNRSARRAIDYEHVWALRDVDLTVAHGEIIGVCGHNGSGKSTLLRAVGGVLPPTRGRVVVKGRMTPILDMGIGLHPDATGRESILFFGALLGRDTGVMRERAPEIADWAGLHNYVDRPLRAYSAGMMARLSFAVLTDATADVVLIDEVLSVGDAAFQRKSLARVHELTSRGSTVVIVSHDLETLQEHCHRMVWLDNGAVGAIGAPEEVVATYVEAAVRAQIP
jgi:ABC-type polysaccharide/polyol phosphate transport system ATPase subunit